MDILIGLFLIILLFGLIFRSKGDSFLDTLQSGCGVIFVIVIVVILYFVFK